MTQDNSAVDVETYGSRIIRRGDFTAVGIHVLLSVRQITGAPLMTKLRKLQTLAVVAGVAALVSTSALVSAQQSFVDLGQNWTDADRTAWYGGTQGSRLIPRVWLEALEQPGGTSRFLDDAHIEKFRYLPRSSGLPVGFSIDESDDEALSTTRLRWKSGQDSKQQWVGFNCSACHTGQITYQGRTLRVDGGPTLADFQGFMESLNRALTQTHDDPTKFARFAARVLATEDTDVNRLMLKGELGKLVTWQLRVERVNATDLRYGYARLDAFGHIYNKVALAADAPNPKPNPSDAPVSYPFLWNVPQHDKVQWNGMAEQKVLPGSPASQPFDVGALGRNTGEVIGVFADIKLVPGTLLTGYRSSINVSNMVSLEQMLGRLQPPAWPSAVFGNVDAGLVARGKELFAGDRCERCHSLLDRTDLKKAIEAKMTPLSGADAIGTDPWMACNAYVKEAPSGVLQGTGDKYLGGKPLEASAPLADMLTVAVAGSLAGDLKDVIASITRSFFGRQPPPVVINPDTAIAFGLPASVLSEREQRLNRCMNEKSGILAYKGRPLNGIWATAPYLHNGSVPTLHELLLPPSQRRPLFWVGSREFDPKDVGYVLDEGRGNTWLFRTRDVQGRMIDGNSNAGHDYGNAGLTEQDRRALIEYLKTL